MKTKWAVVALAALTIASASAVWAMAGVYGKGDPSKPISKSNWPAGVTVLANRADRVGGSWVNQSDTFIYKGDAKAFNQFLAQYARLPGVHASLILQNGDGITVLLPSQTPRTVEYDWQFDTSGWSGLSTGLRLPLNGSIALKDIKVPANVSVGFLGPGQPTNAVKLFLAEHAKRQKNKP